MGNSDSEVRKVVTVHPLIHREIVMKATWNGVKIYALANALLKCMLEKHPDECEEIIKKLKMKK